MQILGRGYYSGEKAVAVRNLWGYTFKSNLNFEQLLINFCVLAEPVIQLRAWRGPHLQALQGLPTLWYPGTEKIISKILLLKWQ